MANKRGRGRSSAKGMFFSGAIFIIICGFLMSFVKANDIHNLQDLYNWAHQRSETAKECTESGKNWFQCYVSGDFGDVELDPIDLPKVELPGVPEITPDSLPKLDEITIGEPDTNASYSRKNWKHWIKQDNGCTTRDNVLANSGTNVQKKGNCKVVSGEWIDYYTGDKITKPGAIDIDHVPPLGYVATHGGAQWSPEKKQQFANDPSHLLAVSARENRVKGAKGPSEYMPPDESFHCEYAQIWLSSSKKYGFYLEQADKDVLMKALQTCK